MVMFSWSFSIRFLQQVLERCRDISAFRNFFKGSGVFGYVDRRIEYQLINSFLQGYFQNVCHSECQRHH